MNEVECISMSENSEIIHLSCFDVIDCRLIQIIVSTIIEHVDDKVVWNYKDYFDLKFYEQQEFLLWYGEWNEMEDEDLERCLKERVHSGYYNYNLIYRRLRPLG